MCKMKIYVFLLGKTSIYHFEGGAVLHDKNNSYDALRVGAGGYVRAKSFKFLLKGIYFNWSEKILLHDIIIKTIHCPPLTSDVLPVSLNLFRFT